MFELGAFCGKPLEVLSLHQRGHIQPTALVQLENKHLDGLAYKSSVFKVISFLFPSPFAQANV